MSNYISAWRLRNLRNPFLLLPIIAIALGIFNSIPNHFTVVCGLQSIGIQLGVSCP